MIDITSNLTFEDSVLEISTEYAYQFEKIIRTAHSNIPFFIHSCTIQTSAYYYYQTTSREGDVIKKEGIAGFILIEALFEDDTKQVVGSTYVKGKSDGYGGGLYQETNNIIFSIPEEQAKKRIKELYFTWEKDTCKNNDTTQIDLYSRTETHINIISITVYGKLAGVDSGLRVAGKNGQVFKILETTEPSPLKFFYKRVRNIMLVPTDHPLASPLRIKTADGIMSIAVEK